MHSRVYVALVSTAGAVLIAIVSSYATVAAAGRPADAPSGLTRQEVRALMRSENPYLEDRRFILAGIDRIERELQQLRRAVQAP